MTGLGTLNERLAALMEATGTPLQDLPSALPQGQLTELVIILIAIVESLAKRVAERKDI